MTAEQGEGVTRASERLSALQRTPGLAGEPVIRGER